MNAPDIAWGNFPDPVSPYAFIGWIAAPDDLRTGVAVKNQPLDSIFDICKRT
jgi:hypothetical protein